jgi:eukaryotic-like serine/threonine-protein kinase
VDETLQQLQTAFADRYRIERELGRGGMATVYLAEDLKHGRNVAIKVLNPELAANLGAERFDREIRMAAQLQHPHIVSLYDSGSVDGFLYYVMPFVPGESLRDRLNRENQLPIDDALQITLEVCDALSYAHSMGIVHRDIKPENIMLSGGHALVADFGIARAVASAETSKLTQTGTAIGTPLYMSPEQAVGDNVGPTSDLYSLGCVMYEMLIGQPPFTGPNARAIMARHAMEVVPSLQVVRDTVPDEVEDAIIASLAKTPADRPQTATQLAEMLGVPLHVTAARRTTRATSSRRATTRTTAIVESSVGLRRWIIGGTFAIFVLLVGGGIAAWRIWAKPETARATNVGGLDAKRIAVLYFDDLSKDHSLGFLADGLTENLINELRTVRSLDVISRNGVEPFRSSEVARDSIGRALNAGTLVDGEVEPEGDQIRVTVRLIDGNSGADFERRSFQRPASDLTALRDSVDQEVAELIRKQLGEEIRLREQRQSTSNTQAWAMEQRAERSLKQDNLDQADTLAAAARQLDPKWIAPILMRTTVAYQHSRRASDDPAAAGKLIDHGLTYADSAAMINPDDPDLLEVRGNLRYWRWLLGLETDATAASQLLKQAQTDLETAVKLQPSQAGAWATLSHLYNQTGSGVDVNLAARRALEEDAYLSNANVILSRLFLSSYDLGQFTDAVHWCEEGERRFPTDPNFVECQIWLMTTRAKDPDPALAWKLADSVNALSAPEDTAYKRYYERLIVAAVLARAGQADSARHLVSRYKGDAALDPTRDLAFISAFVYTTLGDKSDALQQLKIYLAASPGRRAAFADDPGWWFRDLQNDPQFQQAVNSKP